MSKNHRKSMMAISAGLVVLSATTGPAWAEDPALPTFRTFAGAFFAGDQHDYFVESELSLPAWVEDGFGFYYRYRETTPFIGLEKGGQQAELLYTRQEFQADLKLADSLRLLAVGGYHARYNQDRNGKRDAYALGAGLGSPRSSGAEWLSWWVAVGGYTSGENVTADWWGDARIAWRVAGLGAHRHLESDYRTALVLSADIETANKGDRISGMYRVGPELQFLTANGNRANLHARWYVNDGNEFYRSDEEALLVGFEVVSSLDTKYVYNARTERKNGVFPMVWGAYDVGIGDTRRISRFEMNVEAFDLKLADQLYTFFIWYENRQEHRVGDYDNVAYSVSIGCQSPLGWESWFSQGQPLVAGCDFLHRSDHALNADRDRMKEDGKPSSDPTMRRLIPNGAHDVIPRLRLQTIGWDLPYRDPSMYDDKTAWLHFFDWRMTLGYTMSSDRDRGSVAGQAGLNWDAATIRGFVVYGRAIGSVGNETPDWLFEAGVRRPTFRVFARYEDYGIKDTIAQGKTFVTGIGFSL
jgi:hypothetical protein